MRDPKEYELKHERAAYVPCKACLGTGEELPVYDSCDGIGVRL